MKRLLLSLILGIAIFFTATSSGAQTLTDLTATWAGDPTPGETGRLAVSWKGEPGAELSVALDFDGDGSFDASELVIDRRLLDTGIEIFEVDVPVGVAVDGATEMQMVFRERGEKSGRKVVRTVGWEKGVDGCSWEALPNTGTIDGWIEAMTVYDDGSGPALIVGGIFQNIGAQRINRIARWNGSNWSPLASGTNGQVRSLAVFDGDLYAGGSFWIAGDTDAANIARWNGTTWRSVDSGVNSAVYAMVSHNNGSGDLLYVGGCFNNAGGLQTSKIASWDGNSWSAQGFSAVETLCTYSLATSKEIASPLYAYRRIYSGGLINLDGAVVEIESAEERVLGMDSSFIATSNDLIFYDGGDGENLYSTGLHGSAILVKWNGNSWDSVISQPEVTITTLGTGEENGNKKLYVSGPFNEIGSASASKIARWDGKSWFPLDSGLDNSALTMTTYDDGTGPALYVGGNFSSAGGVSASKIARWRCSPVPDPEISMTRMPSRVIAGQPVQYRIEVGNNGSLDASPVVLEDEFPAALSCSWKSNAVGGAFGNTDNSGPKLQNTLSLPIGSQVIYTIDCDVPSDTQGSIKNRAVLFFIGDADDSNNSDEDTTTVRQEPDLTLILTDDDNNATAGGRVTYTLTATNNGPSRARAAQLFTTISDELTCSWTVTPLGEVTGYSDGAGSLDQTLEFPVGTSVIYTFDCQIDINTDTDVTFAAQINAGQGSTDPNTGNNGDSDTNVIVPGADLQVSASEGADTLVAGGTATYNVVVKNRGPQDSEDAAFRITFSDTLQTCHAQGLTSDGTVRQLWSQGTTLEDTLDLAVDASVHYVVSCSVGPSASGSITVDFSVESDTDPIPSNDTFVDTDSVIGRPAAQTIILTHPARMQTQMGTDSEGLDAFLSRLDAFANHPRVQGVVVDMGYSTDLEALYTLWDADVTDGNSEPETANDILFGCPTERCGVERQGLRALLAERLGSFPEVRHLMIVGDDRIVPMARILDITTLASERDYIESSVPDLAELDGLSTTVGQALADDHFLSDDPLGTLGPFDADATKLAKATLVPDLAVGRLVETLDEILGSLQNFLDLDGTVDLTQRDPDHRVLVTGYDFLVDSARRIHRRWGSALDRSESADLVVNGELIGFDWGLPSIPAREDALYDALSGNGLGTYGILSLNGHATHYEEGVPGQTFIDIEGLLTERIDELDLTGSAIYAVGCHGGLPVADATALASDNPLDLPQTFLRRGALAYVANSGFGWGLPVGIGYSERLVSLFTEELTQAGPITFGDAILRTKERYAIENTRFEAYDTKVSMQWTLFGFPMTAIRTGIGTEPTGTGDPGYIVSGRPSRSQENAPDFLLPVSQSINLTGGGILTKFDASGNPVPDGVEGCPDPGPDGIAGCYYTFNEFASSEADLPIEPYLIEDSLRANTSLHGVLWMGGEYQQEQNWTPVFAELVSNGGAIPLPDVLPQTILVRPVSRPKPTNPGSEECRAADTDLNKVIVNLGELVEDATGESTIHRIHRRVDLDYFFYNNSNDPLANCDREGPQITPGFQPEGLFHTVEGSTVRFVVNATDQPIDGVPPGDVWRVVVVYDDPSEDLSEGLWKSLDLTLDAGHWQGEIQVDPGNPLTYFVQAVDTRGNVSWALFGTEAPSGIDPGLPLPTEVDGDSITRRADLSVSLGPVSDEAVAGADVLYDLTVTNQGPNDATGEFSLDPPAGWVCTWDAEDDERTGSRNGTAPVESVALAANGEAKYLVTCAVNPEAIGEVTLGATVTVVDGTDPHSANNSTELMITVDRRPDVDVQLSNGVDAVNPGDPVVYGILVSNFGPSQASEVTLQGTFPPFLECSWTSVANGGASGHSAGSGPGIDDVLEMPVGSSVSYFLSCALDESAEGVLELSVTASAEGDPNVANDSATDGDPISIFYDGFESGDCSGWDGCPLRRAHGPG